MQFDHFLKTVDLTREVWVVGQGAADIAEFLLDGDQAPHDPIALVSRVAEGGEPALSADRVLGSRHVVESA